MTGGSAGISIVGDGAGTGTYDDGVDLGAYSSITDSDPSGLVYITGIGSGTSGIGVSLYHASVSSAGGGMITGTGSGQPHSADWGIYGYYSTVDIAMVSLANGIHWVP